jgi:hypothetical protein
MEKEQARSDSREVNLGATETTIAELLDEEKFEELKLLLRQGANFFLSVSRTDLNKDRLKATQTFIDPEKLKLALKEKFDPLPISATIRRRMNSKGKVVIEILIGNGTHRLGYALLSGRTANVIIKNIWDENNGDVYPNVTLGAHEAPIVIGFNYILNKIKDSTGQK